MWPICCSTCAYPQTAITHTDPVTGHKTHARNPIRKILLTAALVALASTGVAFAEGTPSPKGAKVYFLTLKVGATVKSPFKVQFGLSGMGVAPAGVNKAKTGHHHLLIDRPALGKGPNGKEELTANLSADKHHKHFGGGQTETMVTLSPGKHTQQLVLGDMNHIPFNPLVVSQRITVTVK